MPIDREPMMEIFIFETQQLIEQLEEIILLSEKENSLERHINEIFRIMHTIKGSSAMMLFNNISIVAHSIEDLFFYLRENKLENLEYEKIADIVLEGMDFIKEEIIKIESGKNSDKNPDLIIAKIEKYLESIKDSSEKEDFNVQTTEEDKNPFFYITSDKKEQEEAKESWKIKIGFEEGCEMENVRAFTVIHQIQSIANVIEHYPKDVIEDSEASEFIQKNGFNFIIEAKTPLDKIKDFLNEVPFVKEIDIQSYLEKKQDQEVNKELSKNTKNSMISVNINKLDALMDLVGELVIAESMVTQNPELKGLVLGNFHKSANRLNKIIHDLQNAVMDVRMVSLSATFQKMNRIVRDMSKKMNKEVELNTIGTQTEVDKTIIEHISDPLMHLIRNSIDHGIEKPEERIKKGKNPVGKITLEARNAGGDVWIIIKDDGKGLDKDKILQKAIENGIIDTNQDELSDKEIYSCIFMAGFSTKEKITEFSGRGVGMDVVSKNIEQIRGIISVDSKPNEGTTIFIKIPLTLAIMDGMVTQVGESSYIIPTMSIRESIKIKKENVISDLRGNEMILIRGECYPVFRLHKFYEIQNNIKEIDEGIVVMVEYDGKYSCILVDNLIGTQQVVVKSLPKYMKKVKGIAGCTLLGDGSISLILDIPHIING